jgi:hypothetical protein
VGPGLKSIGGLAGQASDWLNRVDPSGTALESAADRIHEGAAWGSAFVVGYFASGFDSKKALELADATVADIQRERMRQQMAQSDAWSQFMRDAANLPVAPPARPMRP